ncbi:MAG: multicopper oxidase family protein [Bosea sp. (in: a-proteobacteria)]
MAKHHASRIVSRRTAIAGIAALAASPVVAQPRPTQRAAPTAEAQTGPREVRHTLNLAPARARLRPTPPVDFDVWATDGMVPARPMRIKLGDTALVTVNNRTDQPLALHWQGLRGQAAMDGIGSFSQDPIAPGGSYEYRLTPPDPGTLFWRPVMLGNSGPAQDRGLFGALIVEEANPPPVDLDIVVVVDDWLLTDDNKVAPFERGTAHAAAGRLGSWITVNGRSAPERIPVAQGARVRLRLISACNARLMRLRFDGMRPYVIAVDGQPTDSFEPLRAALPFAPGTRYDLLIDVPAEAGAVGSVIAQLGGGVPLVMLTATDRQIGRPALPPIGPVAENKLLPAAVRLQDAHRAEMIIEGGAKAGADGKLDLTGIDLDKPWRVNGAPGSIGAKPLFSVPRGKPVVLAVTNKTIWTQVIHLHGHVTRLLHPLDDGWEPYWTDNAQIPEGKTLRFAFRTENPGKWLISSGVIERFDAGLWGWFEVTG